MQKYHPGNHVPLMGLLVLVLATIAGGLIVGAGIAIAAHFIYLVMLFPLIMGLVGGAIVVVCVKNGKVRSRLTAGLFGMLIALLIYGTYRYGEYFDAQRQLYDTVKAEYGDVSENEAAIVMDSFLRKETGSTGFIGYVLYDAKNGVKITRTVSSSSSSGITFAGPMAWGYWAVELLIIVGIAAVMGYRQAAQPFCEACDTWYGSERWIGSADKKSSKDLKAALSAGEFSSVRAVMTPRQTTVPRLDLTFQRCEHCANANPVLRLKQVTASGRKNTATKELIKGEITPAQFMDLTGQTL